MYNSPKHVVIFTALDGLLSLAVLSVAGYYIDYFYKAIESGSASGKWNVVALMFLGMAMSQLIRLCLPREKAPAGCRASRGFYCHIPDLCSTDTAFTAKCRRRDARS